MDGFAESSHCLRVLYKLSARFEDWATVMSVLSVVEVFRITREQWNRSYWFRGLVSFVTIVACAFFLFEISKMSSPSLVNPNGQLLPEIAGRLLEARKNKPLWAKRLDSPREVSTLEGMLQANAGDYLCRGLAGEQWPQKEKKLLEKYSATGEIDADGWERFDPKPDSQSVEATAIEHPFRVTAQWGELSGKAGDYLVRSRTDPTDIWLVDKTIFEASYEFVPAAK